MTISPQIPRKPGTGARMRRAAAVTLALFGTYLFALSPAVAAVPRCFGLKARIIGARFGGRVNGTDGRDVIVGLGGADRINGRGGDDVICGGRGRDRLIGGEGNDRLAGEEGADVLVAGPGDDLIDGGPGDFDKALFGSATAPVTADLTAGTVAGDGSDTLGGVEGLVGSAFDDSLTGNDASNLLDGGAGNDTLSGNGGDDVFLGAEGDDRLDGGEGLDMVLYVLADTPVTADLANGTVTGEGADTLSSIDDVFGSDFDDVLTGTSGPNLLIGGLGGHDRISAGDGDDIVLGDFAFCFFGCFGQPGNDVLDGAGDDLASFAVSSSPVVASLADGTAVGPGSDSLIGFESLEGSWFDDSLAGDAGTNDLFEGFGDDVLSGAEGNDRLDGGEDVDGLDGGDGTDNCVNGETVSTCESATPFSTLLSGSHRLWVGSGRELITSLRRSDEVRHG